MTKAIIECLRELNEKIEEVKHIISNNQQPTTPSPDVAGSDAVAFAEWIGANYVTNGPGIWSRERDMQRAVTPKYSSSQLYAKFREEHPQPAGASVEDLQSEQHLRDTMVDFLFNQLKIEGYSMGSESDSDKFDKERDCRIDRAVEVLTGAAFQAAQGDATYWKAENANTLEWLVMFVSALKELVELKSIKDTVGKNADYETRQPAAWKTARDYLELWERDGNYGRPVTQPAPAAVSAGTIPAYLRDALDNWGVAWQEFNTGYRNVNGQTTRIGIAALSQATNQADNSLRIAWHQAKNESAPGIPDVRELVEKAEVVVETYKVWNDEPRRLAEMLHGDIEDLQTALAGIKRK